MSLSRREWKELVGILFAAVFTAAVTYYYLQSVWALVFGLLMGAVLGTVRWGARWAARRDRFGIGTAITLLLAAVAVYVLVRAIHFGANAVPGQAHVETSTSSRGRGDARIVHEVEGKPVRAGLRTWFYALEKDSDVAILYLPEEPERVELDSFWQRYVPAGLLLAIFGGAAVWELTSFLPSRRKSQAEPPQNVTNPSTAIEPRTTADPPGA